MQEYIFGLYEQKNAFLKDLRIHAESQLVPIITKDTERLIYTLVKIKEPKKILEIGTAVGYSALCFADAYAQSHITTLEVRETSFLTAKENIKKMGAEDRVTPILGKAEEILPQIKESFDLIFIDAAKGQYQLFFDLCKKNMRPGTLIISDNVLHKGMPASDEFITIRRNKTIAKRLRSYLTYLTTHPQLETSVLSVGDGVAITLYQGEPSTM